MAEEQQTIKKKISLTIKIKEKNLYSLRDPIGRTKTIHRLGVNTVTEHITSKGLYPEYINSFCKEYKQVLWWSSGLKICPSMLRI